MGVAILKGGLNCSECGFSWGKRVWGSAKIGFDVSLFLGFF